MRRIITFVTGLLLLCSIPSQAEHFNPLLNEISARLALLANPQTARERSQKAALTRSFNRANQQFVSVERDLAILGYVARTLNRSFPNDATFNTLLNDLANYLDEVVIDDWTFVSEQVEQQPALPFKNAALRRLAAADVHLTLASETVSIPAVARRLDRALEHIQVALRIIGVAPVSVAGYTFRVEIVRGSGDFPRSGTYDLVISESDDTYQLIGGAGLGGSSVGTYTYRKAAPNRGIVIATDSNDLSASTFVFDLTTPNRAIVTRFSDSARGAQRGIATF